MALEFMDRAATVLRDVLVNAPYELSLSQAVAR